MGGPANGKQSFYQPTLKRVCIDGKRTANNARGKTPVGKTTGKAARTLAAAIASNGIRMNLPA